jgi:hypothetical protein
MKNMNNTKPTDSNEYDPTRNNKKKHTPKNIVSSLLMCSMFDGKEEDTRLLSGGFFRYTEREVFDVNKYLAIKDRATAQFVN